MRSLRSVTDVYPRARTDGLTADQVADSRARFGLNRLTPLPREPAWVKYLGKFDEPIIKILLAASLLKIVLDLFEAAAWAGLVGLGSVAALLAVGLLPRVRRWAPALSFVSAAGLVGLSQAVGHPSVEGLAVMLAVALATGVSFLSEYKSDREFEALNARKDAIRATAVRGGRVSEVPLDELAVGDLVELGPGAEIPADGRTTLSNDLLIDQSLMTGESEPVAKGVSPETEEDDGPDRPGCVYRGTQVVGGAGRMLVTNVGDDTMLGQIARRLTGDPAADDPDAAAGRVHRKLAVGKEQTPLQEKLEALARLISRVGYAAAAAIFVTLFARGLIAGELRWPAAGENVTRVLLADFDAVLGYFVYMVVVIVVAVPEGLPMSVTVSLALAMRKMTRANALVRQLVATETIGSATVICTDKTGTLTQNRMTVARVFLGGRTYQGGLEPGLPTGPGTAHELLAVNAAVNSTAHLIDDGGRRRVVGNTTEGALLLWLADGAWRPGGDGPIDYRAVRAGFPVVHQELFSSDRKRMTTVVEAGGRLLVLVKGAPEAVLLRCESVAGDDGSVSPLGAVERLAVETELAAAAAGAMRTLGFAYRELPGDTPREQLDALARSDDLEAGLTFVGFVGIHDPLRADVVQAVRQCHSAGIEVKMITGDNPETARAIAAECGLLDRPDAVVMTSDEFDKLPDDALKDRLPRLRVLARAKPLDKYRLVRLLQEDRHVVAMTGDGTNDAPSLRKADVGLAMGRAGTEVAKEASKIVLLDDAFGTIVRAVHWGRALYENIQKFVVFQLTINVSALAIAFLGPFLGLRPPFTVLQLLWINVIMDTFAAIALCSEPPRPGLMRVPPKRRDESILTRGMVTTILTTAAFFVAVMFALLVGMQHGGWFAHPPGGPRSAPSDQFAGFTVRQVTIFFTVYVFFQVWNQINCRSLTPDVSGLRGLFRNPVFWAITLAIVIGQAAIVTFGGIVFHTEPLRGADWAVTAAATASVLVFAEIVRRVRRVSAPRRGRSGG
jgi:Ca2+-transporting ATPase